MSLRVKRSDWFLGDLEHYAARYDREASWDIAVSYLSAVSSTLARLAENPELGRKARFDAAELAGIRIAIVEKPFHKHLIFYRFDAASLYIERAVHGAMDLPRRLQEPPG